MKLKLPYEITKLFETKKNSETGKKEISLKRDYAYPIEENFKAIKKNINVNLGIGLEITWTDWTPTYSAESPMTYTSVTTVLAKYCVIDKICFFTLCCYGTTGGGASVALSFTPPIATAENANYIGGSCMLYDDLDHIAGAWYSFATTIFKVYRYDGGNWGLGSNRRIIVQGFYRIA